MNVTEQVRRTAQLYGASDSARSEYNAATKSLNYANGNTWQDPAVQTVGVIPYTMRYKDDVGLFGAENFFLRIDLNVTGTAFFLDADAIVNDYYNAKILTSAPELDEFYDGAIISDIIENDPGWIGALITEDDKLPYIGPDAYVSIDLNNIKSGNKYLDAWLDTRLYTKQREEWPYDKAYVRIRDKFYLGIHARNTKRLPYNIELTVGERYLTYDQIPDKEYIMK
jgi:hypothetical protein